jgi:hypothetical protein
MILFDVPLRTDDDRYLVTETDVRAWIVCAVLEEDIKSKTYLAQIAQLDVSLWLRRIRWLEQRYRVRDARRGRDVLHGRTR